MRCLIGRKGQRELNLTVHCYMIGCAHSGRRKGGWHLCLTFTYSVEGVRSKSRFGILNRARLIVRLSPFAPDSATSRVPDRRTEATHIHFALEEPASVLRECPCLRAVRLQVLRVRNENGGSNRRDALAGLRLHLTDERTVDIPGGAALTCGLLRQRIVQHSLQ